MTILDPTGLSGPSSHSAQQDYPAVMYRCFDANGDLLYIGATSYLHERKLQHARRAAWWPEVVGVTTEPYDHKWQALAAERTAIVREHPRHNRQRYYVNLLAPSVLDILEAFFPAEESA